MKETVRKSSPESNKPDRETLLLIGAVAVLFGTMLIHFSVRTWLILFTVGFVLVSWYSHLE